MAHRSGPEAGELARHLCGRRLPGGEFVISSDEADLVRDLTGYTASHTHPVFACIASLRALGVSLGDLCELCGFDIADGPLLGECDMELSGEFQPGTRYLSSAVIETFERVTSRRLGLMDRLGFVVRLETPDGAMVATIRYLWLLPRGMNAA